MTSFAARTSFRFTRNAWGSLPLRSCLGRCSLFTRVFAHGGGFIGDFARAGLTGITPESSFPGGEALEWPMVVFHLSFAIITAALVIGSFAVFDAFQIL